MKRRIHSFVWGGIVCLLFIALGIAVSVSISNYSALAFFGALGVLSFTLISCLILDNNFLGAMMGDIFSWSFVRMPGLIFTLDLDGIIWLLTVKLLFWVIGFSLAFVCGGISIGLGLLLSVFVYPFALYKSFHPDESAPL